MMKKYQKPVIKQVANGQLEVVNAASGGCPYGCTKIDQTHCMGRNWFTHTESLCPYYTTGGDRNDLRYGKCSLGVQAPVW